MQGVHASNLLVGALTKLQMQMRISGVIIANLPNLLALGDTGTGCDRVGNLREVKIKNIEFFAIWSFRLDDDMTRGIAACSPVSGVVHSSVAHSVNRGPEWCGHVNPVVKVPTIPIDARPDRRFHHIALHAVTEWSNVE